MRAINDIICENQLREEFCQFCRTLSLAGYQHFIIQKSVRMNVFKDTMKTYFCYCHTLL